MRSVYLYAFGFLCCALLVFGAQPGPVTKCSTASGKQTLFQVSTLDALTLGIYDGAYPIERLKQHGNFGLGTFEGLDGEMVVLDGHYYHFHSDGSVTEAENHEKIPFAAVTEFEPDFRFTIQSVSMDDLGTSIDQLLPSTNLFYAVKIHGKFTAMSTRAIPKQSIP